MKSSSIRCCTVSAIALLVAACGGGGSSALSEGSDEARAAAATATAENNPKCSLATLGGYYWEIGDAGGVKVSGAIGGSLAPTRSTRLWVFSASKWLYAASVVQRRGVQASDVPYLNFTSGYSEFGNAPVCLTGDSVNECLVGRDGFDAGNVGRFAYDSGHMQRHAADVMGLGAADNAALAASLTSALGDLGFAYRVPQLAAGVETTAAGYAAFLQKLLRGELALAASLGANNVCTNPLQGGCNAARGVDISADENLNYSLGHWVEDDSRFGDGAFSSAGGGGFYPWIDRDRTVYGLIARERATESSAGYHSLECGRLIRKAWLTGVQVTTPTP
jgi:hypothetical protein